MSEVPQCTHPTPLTALPTTGLIVLTQLSYTIQYPHALCIHPVLAIELTTPCIVRDPKPNSPRPLSAIPTLGLILLSYTPRH